MERRTIGKALFLLLLLIIAGNAFGQVKPDDSRDVTLYFRSGSDQIERNYVDNNRALADIDVIFTNLKLSDRVDSVVIVASSSSEGKQEYNRTLSEKRAEKIKSLLTNEYGADPRKIKIVPVGEDWGEVKAMVEANPNLPNKGDVLQILNLDKLNNESKQMQIQLLDNGKTLDYIRKNMLPPHLPGGKASILIYMNGKMRPVEKEAIILGEPLLYLNEESLRVEELNLPVPPPLVVEQTTTYTTVERTRERVPVTDAETDISYRSNSRKFYMAVKTNLLSDLLLTPNIGLEFFLGKGFSVGLDYSIAWWRYAPNRCQILNAGGVEFRKWFGRRARITPLHGHYIGIYGAGGAYDMMLFGDEGELSYFSYTAGISYGYSVPIGQRLNLEFCLGAGYFGGDYCKYEYQDNGDGTSSYVKTEELQHNSVLPKAKITLVWQIGNGYKYTWKNRSWK